MIDEIAYLEISKDRMTSKSPETSFYSETNKIGLFSSCSFVNEIYFFSGCLILIWSLHGDLCNVS